MTIPFRDHSWSSRDGLKLYARDFAGDDAKAPVICIPGLTRNARDFEEVAPWIANLGRRVLAVDLRGRGRSERARDPKSYAPQVYADDMASLLHSIAAPKAIFIGTSLGGIVTMTLAVRHPGLIAGSVLNDVGPDVAKAGLERIKSYVGKSAPVETWADAAAYAKHINGVAFPDYSDEDWMAFAHRMFKDEGGKPVLDYDARIYRAPSPLAAILARPLAWAAFDRLAKCGPMLLVYGELSDIISPATIARMQRRARRMKVASVPGVGHAPMLTEPSAREAIAAFLSAAGSP